MGQTVTDKNEPVLYDTYLHKMKPLLLPALVLLAFSFAAKAGNDTSFPGSHSAEFSAALKSPGKAGASEAAQVVEGVFLGIEQGDYLHWNMRTTAGDDFSLFILKPGASVTKAADNPEAFKGKRCRVTWKASTEFVPETGGKTEIDQILAVEWLGRTK